MNDMTNIEHKRSKFTNAYTSGKEGYLQAQGGAYKASGETTVSQK